MTLTREDPRPLRPQLAKAVMRTVLLAAVSVAVFWAVTNYADVAVQYVQRLGLRRRQIEPWRLPVMVVLIGIPIWHTLSAALDLLRVGVRYHRARRWERMLDDPERAAEVPPLGSHLIGGGGPSVGAATATVAGAVLTLLGTVTFLYAGFNEALPFPVSSDALGDSVVFAIGSAWAVVKSSAALSAARRRAKVERLSSSGAEEVASGPAAALSTQIPTLQVRFDQALRPMPGRGTVGRILYLRLFDNRAGTDRFVQRWRRYGVVHYLRSADQVSADELKTWSGQVGDLSVFIDNDAELDELLAATQPVEGPHGYPAGELLCHGSYWKRAVTRLLTEVDFVVLDLTGFTPDHAGTAFEIRSAFDLVAVDRLKLTAAAGSDQRFLNAQLQHSWSQLAAGSPNAGTGVREVTVYLG